MDCESARAAIHAAIDDGVRDAALDQHLAHCGECRIADREIRMVTEALHQLGADTETICSHRVDLPARPRHARWTTPLRAAAVIVLFVGAMWLISRPWSAQEQTVVDVNPGSFSIPDQWATDPADTKPPAGITLQGESSRELMAVAARTSDSGVQMYWLYPKLSRLGAAD